MPQQSRQVAKITTTRELNSGKYFQQEGFDPNYLLTPEGRRISRGRLVATVVDTFVNEDETYASLTVDDGEDTIQIKFFNELELMRDFSTGDIIEVVGKVREYQGEIYFNGEILRSQKPVKEFLHKLRYKKHVEEWKQMYDTIKQLKESGKSQDDIEKEMAGKLNAEEVDAVLQSFGEHFDTVETEETVENLERDVLDAVEKLDEGEGADYSEILETVEDATEDQLEDTINSLLSDGTCYEPKPGMIKKL